MSSIKSQMFLVKIPDILYNQINNKEDIGKITISNYNQEKPDISINIEGDKGIKNYNLAYNNDDYLKYFYFYDNKEQKNIELKENNLLKNTGKFVLGENNIENSEKIDNKPKNKPKTIFLSPTKGKRETNVIEIKGRENQQYSSTKEKRVRKPKEILTKEIIELFETYQFLSLKHITETLKQPEAAVKEILQEIAVFINEGEHKKTYKLKDY